MTTNTHLMQIPSENASEGRNQTEPVSCRQNPIFAAQRVFHDDLLDRRP